MRIRDWSSDVCSSDLRHLMLRLLDGHGVAVVDPLARFVIGPAMRRAGRREVEVGEVEARRHRQVLCRHRVRQVRQHRLRSEEHTSELQSLMRSSYAVFCLKKKKLYLLNAHTHN